MRDDARSASHALASEKICKGLTELPFADDRNLFSGLRSGQQLAVAVSPSSWST